MTSQDPAAAHDDFDVQAIAQQIQALIDERLIQILPARQAEFDSRFARDGDMAYGALNTELFLPVRKLLRDLGLRARPRLPGGFQESREWGNADETHQQRWMWSFLQDDAGRSVGAIAVGSHHDHSRFRLPRSPEVLGLAATTLDDLVIEMSDLHSEFAQAPSFNEWYRDYLEKVRSEPNAQSDG